MLLKRKKKDSDIKFRENNIPMKKSSIKFRDDNYYDYIARKRSNFKESSEDVNEDEYNYNNDDNEEQLDESSSLENNDEENYEE